jgi:hypothetical protein
MRNEILLTDDQIEDVFSEIGLGATIDSLTFTRETLADFNNARKSWKAFSHMDADTTDDLSYAIYFGVQTAKGQPRQDIYIVDFGSVRAVYMD